MLKQSQLKRWLKLAVFSLLPAIVLLAAAEAYATFTIERRITEEKDPASGQVVYTMRTGRFPWSRAAVTPLNSLGLPDVEFTSDPDECVHIVFSGDSFIFGDGVDRDSSFVSLVRRWSEERRPLATCVRVFNIGERGTTIDRQAERIRETIPILQPDLVILGQYQNDLTDLTNSRASAAAAALTRSGTGWTDVRQRLGGFNLNVVRWMSYRAFGAAIERRMHYDVLAHWSVVADTSRHELAGRLMTTYAQFYDSLTRELQAQQIDFGVVIIPSKFDLLAGRFPEEDFFVRIAKEHNVPYLQIFPVLDDRRSPYPYLMYDGHFNEHGNRLVADAVFDWLYEARPFEALQEIQAASR